MPKLNVKANLTRSALGLPNMSTLAQRLERALAERKQSADPSESITKAGLARACGIKAPSVSAWFSGDTAEIEGKNLLAAAAYLKVRPEWLATGRGPKSPQSDGPPIRGGMQPLVASAFTLPPSLSWEQVMQSSELPTRFVIEVPDDALSPNLPRGTAVVFERAERAEPESCVLVRDAGGVRYVRRLEQGRAGQWVARAINEAYVTLHSDVDGLKIEAVMRWRAESRI